MVPEDKPEIEVATVISVMEQLIPLLTAEMEKIATALREQKLTDAEFRNQLSQQYIKASGKLTEDVCKKFKLDLHAFQAALMYYQTTKSSRRRWRTWPTSSRRGSRSLACRSI
ncbi:hypothetical protein PRIC1_012317 [Phytophthora ramorum]